MRGAAVANREAAPRRGGGTIDRTGWRSPGKAGAAARSRQSREILAPHHAALPEEVDRGDEDATVVSGHRAVVRPARTNLIDAIWRQLSSVRFPLILTVCLALASLAGILLPQVPGGVSGDAAGYAGWVERIRPKYGFLTDVLSGLGLFDLFNAPWFKAMLGLLCLSIVACSLNRWRGVARSITRPRVRLGPGFFRSAPLRSEVKLAGADVDLAGDATAAVLKSRGYRVLEERAEGVRHFYADRNRFAQLGTFAFHLGLVLMLVSALLGGIVGRADRAFAIPEGSVRPVGFGTDLAVRLESFADEYYPEGPPMDYRSELVVYKGGAEARRQTIRVNEPLEYDGWRFHQSYFGPAAILEVRDKGGQVLFSDGVALSWRTTGDRPMGSFLISERGLTAYLVGPASGGGDSVIRAGELRLEIYRSGAEGRPIVMETLQQGEPKVVEGLTFTFLRERQFSGLQVVRDPAAPLLYTAWILAAAGLIAVCYFPYRRLWARCEAEGDAVRLSLGTTGRTGAALTREFAGVVEAAEARLGSLERRRNHA